MRDFRMTWLFIVLFLSFIFNSPVEAKPGKKLASAVVVGSVYCDTCFHQDFSESSHFIPGASVAVKCRDGNSRLSFQKEVTADKHGQFRVFLPFSVAKHVRKIDACSVKLIRSSEPNCAVASMAASSSLNLKSRKEGTHIFSAGFFTFKPQKLPNLCSQEPSLQNSRKLNSEKTSFPPSSDPTFPPPIQDPATPDHPPLGQNHLPYLPPIPKLPPLPELPPLPRLPELPTLPPLPGNAAETKTSEDKLGRPKCPRNPLQRPPTLPPNPFQHPPLLSPPSFQPPLAPVTPLPPNPLRPPTAPLTPLPPNPFQPPLAPLTPLPPNPLRPPTAPLTPLPPNRCRPPTGPLTPLPPNSFQPPLTPLTPLPPNPRQPPTAPLTPLPPNPCQSPTAPLTPLPPTAPLTPLPPNPLQPPRSPLIPVPPTPIMPPILA